MSGQLGGGVVAVGVSASSDSAKLSTWREWKTRNGSRADWLAWINYRLRHSPLVQFLEYAGKFTIVAAVISGAVSAIQWRLEAGDRAKERHYRAWELINTARGSTGDGGRRDALQDLNKDGVSLAAAPLEQAYLPEVDLVGADLKFSNLKGADLRGAKLESADLWLANLQSAILWSANLKNADLKGANLDGVRGLTQDQLDAAEGDAKTKLPEGLTRPAHWPKTETTTVP